jgi:hypothetical protein
MNRTIALQDALAAHLVMGLALSRFPEGSSLHIFHDILGKQIAQATAEGRSEIEVSFLDALKAADSALDAQAVAGIEQAKAEGR